MYLGDLIDYIRNLIIQSGIKIDERYFPETAYSAPSELRSLSVLPTYGFTGGYSHIAT